MPTVEAILRELAPLITAAVERRHGDFGAAEDAVQEALIAAAARWPVDGVPQNPRGWLYHVALRRLTDAIRSDASRRRREEAIGAEMIADWALVPPPEVKVGIERDDTLPLLFMCCHPALSTASAIALTLRAVGGLTTAEIASAFLVPEATMGQRISRAKQTLKSSGASLALPGDAEIASRLAAVLHVLYLIFTEGYTASSGESLQRVDLSREAIRLTRLLRELRPSEPEVGGLLALMLLTDARRAARTDADGAIVPLDEQDRSRWDRTLIVEGTALIEQVLPLGSPGPYQLQAAIAALHDQAPSTDATDWPQVIALYDVLMSMTDNPMVALNRAVAVSMVDGPDAALALVESLVADARLSGHHRLDAVRGHLHQRRGDVAAAVRHFRSGAERTASIPERDYLLLKAARLERAAS